MSASRVPSRSLALAGAVAALCAGPLAPSALADGGETVVGELVQAWPETSLEGQHAGESHEEPLTFVEAADGSSVRVPADAVEGVGVGSTVEVTVGGTAEDEAAEDGVEPARQVLDAQVVRAARPATTVPTGSVTNQVTVVMVAPAGGTPDGTALADVVDTVNGEVAGFWSEQTGGAVTVGVTAAHDWISTTAGCSDPTALWDEAASRVGFRAGPGRHLLLHLPDRSQDLPGCSYALGEVGTGVASGGRVYVRDDEASLIAHELGHNFGLGHSSGLQCDAAVETGSCRTAAYRDLYDVMGASWDRLGSLTAAQAARLGVLPTAATQTAGPGTTTATLAPLGGGTGTRALRLTDGAGTDYWLEYRTAVGRDDWLAGDNRYRLDSGVLLHRSGAFPDTSLLLDGSPSAAPGWDDDLQTALTPGVPVAVAGGQFTVTVDAVAPAGAAVTVVRAAEAPAPAPIPAASTPPVLPGVPSADDPQTPTTGSSAPEAVAALEVGAAERASASPTVALVPDDAGTPPVRGMSLEGAEAASAPTTAPTTAPASTLSFPVAFGLAAVVVASCMGVRALRRRA